MGWVLGVKAENQTNPTQPIKYVILYMSRQSLGQLKIYHVINYRRESNIDRTPYYILIIKLFH